MWLPEGGATPRAAVFHDISRRIKPATPKLSMMHIWIRRLNCSSLNYARVVHGSAKQSCLVSYNVRKHTNIYVETTIEHADWAVVALIAHRVGKQAHKSRTDTTMCTERTLITSGACSKWTAIVRLLYQARARDQNHTRGCCRPRLTANLKKRILVTRSSVQTSAA